MTTPESVVFATPTMVEISIFSSITTNIPFVEKEGLVIALYQNKKEKKQPESKPVTLKDIKNIRAQLMGGNTIPPKTKLSIASDVVDLHWKNIKESYLYKIFLKSFLLTMDEEFQYIIYIGIDKGDHLLDNEEQQAFITKFSRVFKNITFKFIVFDKSVKKGHHTVMWNIVHKKAYEENCDYFYQCGDDISFKTSGWTKDCIDMLKKHNNIGLTGPINNNPRILTQSFVSRKHMEIFGWYFPEEIQNWGDDDWYNFVYQPDYFYPLTNHYCSNDGGKPRYAVDNKEDFFVVSSK